MTVSGRGCSPLVRRYASSVESRVDRSTTLRGEWTAPGVDLRLREGRQCPQGHTDVSWEVFRTSLISLLHRHRNRLPCPSTPTSDSYRGRLPGTSPGRTEPSRDSTDSSLVEDAEQRSAMVGDKMTVGRVVLGREGGVKSGCEREGVVG